MGGEKWRRAPSQIKCRDTLKDFWNLHNDASTTNTKLQKFLVEAMMTKLWAYKSSLISTDTTLHGHLTWIIAKKAAYLHCASVITNSPSEAQELACYSKPLFKLPLPPLYHLTPPLLLLRSSLSTLFCRYPSPFPRCYSFPNTLPPALFSLVSHKSPELTR